MPGTGAEVETAVEAAPAEAAPPALRDGGMAVVLVGCSAKASARSVARSCAAFGALELLIVANQKGHAARIEEQDRRACGMPLRRCSTLEEALAACRKEHQIQRVIALEISPDAIPLKVGPR
jgi:hypothetical protein